MFLSVVRPRAFKSEWRKYPLKAGGAAAALRRLASFPLCKISQSKLKYNLLHVGKSRFKHFMTIIVKIKLSFAVFRAKPLQGDSIIGRSKGQSLHNNSSPTSLFKIRISPRSRHHPICPGCFSYLLKVEEEKMLSGSSQNTKNAQASHCLSKWKAANLYLTSKRVESSSSSFSSLRGAISTRSAGVVMISYFRVFLILLPDLPEKRKRKKN